MPFREVAASAVKKEEVGLQESDLFQARPKHKILYNDLTISLFLARRGLVQGTLHKNLSVH